MTMINPGRGIDRRQGFRRSSRVPPESHEGRRGRDEIAPGLRGFDRAVRREGAVGWPGALAVLAAVLGGAVFRALLFPLFFLIFLVPVGEELVPRLQDITATIAVRGVQLANVPVFLDGRLISTPTGDFLVAEACAGLRYLTACIVI